MGAVDKEKRYFSSPARSRIEPRLSLLQKRYRTALSGAVVAKARYLAQTGNRFANPALLERAKWKWERIEARRRQLRVELEDLQRSLCGAELREQLTLRTTSPHPKVSKARPNATLELAL